MTLRIFYRIVTGNVSKHSNVRPLGKPYVLLAPPTDDEIERDNAKCFNEDVATRLVRWCVVAFVPTLMLIILKSLTHDDEGSNTHYLSKLLAAMGFIFSTFYFWVLWGQICGIPQWAQCLCCVLGPHSARYLFKIETRLAGGMHSICSTPYIVCNLLPLNGTSNPHDHHFEDSPF